MDAQAHMNSLDDLWEELATTELGSDREQRLFHQIGLMESEIKSHFLGWSATCSKLRARGLLIRHLPRLIAKADLTDVELDVLHGMCRRAVKSKRPFHSSRGREPVNSDSNRTVATVLSELLHLVQNEGDLTKSRFRLHELFVELNTLVTHQRVAQRA